MKNATRNLRLRTDKKITQIKALISYAMDARIYVRCNSDFLKGNLEADAIIDEALAPHENTDTE